MFNNCVYKKKWSGKLIFLKKKPKDIIKAFTGKQQLSQISKMNSEVTYK